MDARRFPVSREARWLASAFSFGLPLAALFFALLVAPAAVAQEAGASKKEEKAGDAKSVDSKSSDDSSAESRMRQRLERKMELDLERKLDLGLARIRRGESVSGDDVHRLSAPWS